ncbi:MAG: NAD(P)-dependent oxidoreductase [SAR86 cluster bacterium]|nr:NAD(P)-dependent oxidoreductase [SAR86 cluster bacterium]
MQKKNKNKILIFGGNGFIGSAVANKLLSQGYSVSVADVHEKPSNKNIEYFNIDITDSKSFSNKLDKDFDIIFNFAAVADIGESSKFFDKTISTNILGNINILNFSKEINIERFVYASSMYVFGDKGGVYGASKKVSEILVQQYAERFGFSFTHLRYGSLYGPGAQDWNSIKRYVKSINKEKQIKHWGTGEEVREYIHVDDAAKLTLKAVEKKYENTALSITGHQKYTSKELISMIFEMMNIKPKITFENKISNEHYKFSPYSHTPLLGNKLISEEYIDFGQGLQQEILKIIEEE